MSGKRIVLLCIALLAVLVGLLLASEAWNKHRRPQVGWTSLNTPNGVRLIVQGHRGDELLFVVFEGTTRPEGSVKSCVKSGSDTDHVSLRKPDGTRMELPARNQLFEVFDDQFAEGTGRITKKELDAFLQSNPTEYSIAALSRFLGRPLGRTSAK
jgi:hypothetical protein